MTIFYINPENEPVALDEKNIHSFVEQGLLRDETYVWTEGLPDWILFGQFKDEHLVAPTRDQFEFEEASPVWEILNHETFLIKKALNTPEYTADFDIFEPEMGALILECRERPVSIKDAKHSEGFNIVLTLPHSGHQVARLNGRFPRTFGLSRGKVSIYDDEDELIGVLKKGNCRPDLVTLHSPDGQNRLVSVRGSLKDWDFQIVGAGFSPMTTSRNWDGEGKELITEDGNFAIVFPSTMPHNDPVREMTLITMLSLNRLFL